MGFFDSIGSTLGGAVGGGFIGGLLGGSPGANIGAGLGGYQGYQAAQPKPFNPGNYKERTGVYAGAPDYPAFQQLGQQLNTQGLDKYRQEALSTGPSAWAGLMGQQQSEAYKKAQDLASGKAAGGVASAESALAMRGGLSSGARERLQKQGVLSKALAGQDLASQHAGNLLQIGINDEQNRMARLGALPGMEVQAMAPAIGQQQLQNQYNLGRYGTEAGIWASGQQANAMDPNNPASPYYKRPGLLSGFTNAIGGLF